MRPTSARAHFHLADRRVGDELETGKGEGKFFCGDLRARPQAIRDGSFGEAAEPFAVGIVDIQDADSRHAGAGAFEEAALGGKIIIESAVKIEMVARQIRKDGSGKAAAPGTVERERMRTGLEHGMRPARLHHFRQERLQVERLRRGGGRGMARQRRAVLDGAEQAALVSCGAQDRIDQKARSRLAVRAGDADQTEFVGRLAEEIRGDDGQRLARVRHANPRDLRRNGAHRGSRRFPAPTRPNPGPGGGAISLTMARAPRAMASGTKRLPSVFSPRMATNRLPESRLCTVVNDGSYFGVRMGPGVRETRRPVVSLSASFPYPPV